MHACKISHENVSSLSQLNAESIELKLRAAKFKLPTVSADNENVKDGKLQYKLNLLPIFLAFGDYPLK